jgi:hypothetical protein
MERPPGPAPRYRLTREITALSPAALRASGVGRVANLGIRHRLEHGSVSRRQPLPKPGTPLPASIYNHALTVGFPRGFVVAAGIALLAMLIAIATIRVSRQELAGAGPEPQEAAPQSAAVRPAAVQSAAVRPAAAQQQEDRAALAAAVRPCRFC